MRKRHCKVVQLALNTADHAKRLAKVNLSVAGGMNQWDKHFPGPPLLLAHIIRNNGDTTRKTMLVSKPGMDTLGCVPLLFDNSFVVFQDLINNRNERIKLGASWP